MICTQLSDDYIEGNPFWIVTLNDGTKVYENKTSAWLDLKEYCDTNLKYISHIHLRFRSHWEYLPKANGYTLIRSALGRFGSSKTTQYYVFGFKNEDFYIQKWRLPELIMETQEHRNFNQYKDLYIPAHERTTITS